VTGFAAVGDAWACTNPSAGRGLSLGLVHAQELRNAVREHLDDPAAFAAAGRDAEVLRGVLETVMCLALPKVVFQRPGIKERIEEADPVPPPPAPGPDRERLLELLRS